MVQEYAYVYNGSSLMQMVVQTTVDDGEPVTETLYFSYDDTGNPMSVLYNGTDYYYTVSLQGDVTAILNTSGTAVVEYTYDAWGNILTVTGSMADTLGAVNPLTYRGYVYDTETGLYYLQSRYYNPETGRFINIDGYLATGQGLLGNNMFAYCLNNPVLYLDILGSSAAIPPMVENGLNLPQSGGIPVEVNGTTYYYAIGRNSNGELYEYWFDSNGDLIRARHHSHHGNPGQHDNPHDHEGTKGRRGRNSVKHERLPVDDSFKSPFESKKSSTSNTKRIVGTATVGFVIGVVAYQIVKWGLATILAPSTGGVSYIVAAAT